MLRYDTGLLGSEEVGVTQVPTVETLQRIGPDAGCDLTARTVASLSYKLVRGRGNVITRMSATVKLRRLRKSWAEYCSTLPHDVRLKLGEKMQAFYDLYDMVEVAEHMGNAGMLRDAIRVAAKTGVELHLSERGTAILRECDNDQSED